jgi:hypothetical protein
VNYPVKVTLTKSELHASNHSALIRYGVYRREYTDKSAAGESVTMSEMIARHCVGMAAETALAKYLGVYVGPGGWCTMDVGKYEVRASDRWHKGMILRPGDKKNTVYYFLSGDHQDWTIHGWINSDDGMIDEHWMSLDNGRPDFWSVPVEKLHKTREPE